ncbi:MAG: hypothetical protein IPP32_05140 [Bacteroidetes bacterium]|nr:hypothetical protein [Bacteroidota bacterium]
MNKANFIIEEVSQEINIIPKHIEGFSDELSSFLIVPVNFIFRQISLTAFDVSSIKFSLSLNNTAVSETVEFTGFSVDEKQPKKEHKESKTIMLPLSEKEISFIEKNRKGDLVFRLRFTGLVTNRKNSPIKTSPVQLIKVDYDAPFCSIFESYIDFEIPQSQWVKSVLPKLNYNNFKLIEVPLHHQHLKEIYSGIFLEFEKADEYFKNHNYNDCIGACRKTHDKIHEELKNIAKNIVSRSNSKWFKETNEGILELITKLENSTYQLSSKSHHTGMKRDFTRHEAESIYLVTLGLVNFVAYH